MTLHEYQQVAVKEAISGLLTHGGYGLWLEPGLGKTVVCLDLINKLLPYRTLVVTLKRVKHHWRREAKKWGYGAVVQVVEGTPGRRMTQLATSADVYVINYEQLPWLVDAVPGTVHPDLLILDESTKIKNWTAKRTKALRKMRWDWSICLSGTPASETYADLFSQIWMLDRGARLGKHITDFRRRFCMRGGFEFREWLLRPGAEADIRERIADICLYQSAVENLDMPSVVHNELRVDLPAKARAVYQEAEDGLLVGLANNPLGVLTPGGAYIKCKQMASGAYYTPDDNSAITLHEAKLDVVEDLLEELNGKPAILGYQFRHDWEAIKRRFPVAVNVDGRSGDVPMRFKVLACQTQALSHGVDGLQKTCSDVIWYSLPDSREVFDQFNARIYRQGQTDHQVRFHYLISRATVDVACYRSLQRKGRLADELKKYLR